VGTGYSVIKALIQGRSKDAAESVAMAALPFGLGKLGKVLQGLRKYKKAFDATKKAMAAVSQIEKAEKALSKAKTVEEIAKASKNLEKLRAEANALVKEAKQAVDKDLAGASKDAEKLLKDARDALNESEKSLGNGQKIATTGPIPAPKEIKGFPGLRPAKPKTPVQGGGGLRKRWTDRDGNIYEWDSRHGAIEKYDRIGKHLGEFDPQTGKQLKPPDPARGPVEP
jgi:hypothetical protein